MPRNRADEKRTALSVALRAMYRAVERRPVPDHLRLAVDQLDRSDRSPLRKVG